MTVTPLFSNIDAEILKLTKNARVSICVVMYSFTNESLLDLLAKKASQGVDVEVILSAGQLKERLENDSSLQLSLENIAQNGGRLFIYVSERGRYGSMHNKYAIFDARKVVTGSFNWTNQASGNEENVVLIEDKGIAKKYLLQTENLLADCEYLTPKLPYIRISPKVLSKGDTASFKGDPASLSWFVPKDVEEWYLEDIETQKREGRIDKIKVHKDRIFKLQAAGKTYTASVYLDTPAECSLRASEKVIVSGDSITLSWETKYAEQVFLEPFGEVGLSGERKVSPREDMEYLLRAYNRVGEVTEASLAVKVLSFEFPEVKSMNVPYPTQIRLESDINFLRTSIPSKIELEATKFDQLQLPRIEWLSFNTVKAPTLEELSKALNKNMEDLEVPQFNDVKKPLDEVKNKNIYDLNLKKVFLGFRTALLDSAEALFKNDPRKAQIISLIRKNYNI